MLNRKIIGIFVMTLLIATAILPVSGIMNVDETDMSEVHKVVKNSDKIILMSLDVSGSLTMEGYIDVSNEDDITNGNILPLPVPPPAGWLSIDFGSAPDIWHETFSTVIPTPPNGLPALFCALETGPNKDHYVAGHQDHIIVDFTHFGINPGNYLNIPGFDMVGKMNYIIADTDTIIPIIYIDATPNPVFVSLSSAARSGLTSPAAWIDFSFEDWLGPYILSRGPYMTNVLEWVGSLFGSGINDVIGIGFRLGGGGCGIDTGGLLTGTWSGMLLDDVEMSIPYSAASPNFVLGISMGTVDCSGGLYSLDFGPSARILSRPSFSSANTFIHSQPDYIRSEGVFTPPLPFCFNIPFGGGNLAFFFGKLPPGGTLSGRSYKSLYS